MSIECFIRWAKGSKRCSQREEPAETKVRKDGGPCVIEDFDAKELFNREWDVPIYGPIRPASQIDKAGKSE